MALQQLVPQRLVIMHLLKLRPRLEPEPFVPELAIIHQQLLQLKVRPQQFGQRHHQQVLPQLLLIQVQLTIPLQFRPRLNRQGHQLQGLEHQPQRQHFKILVHLELQ